MAEYTEFRTKSGDRAWMDDPNTPQRFVVRRAENRFQAYQILESEFYSMGYFTNRSDIRPYLQGYGAALLSDFGENTNTEPLHYKALPLADYS